MAVAGASVQERCFSDNAKSYVFSCMFPKRLFVQGSRGRFLGVVFSSTLRREICRRMMYFLGGKQNSEFPAMRAPRLCVCVSGADLWGSLL